MSRRRKARTPHSRRRAKVQSGRARQAGLGMKASIGSVNYSIPIYSQYLFENQDSMRSQL